jgi:hypothetical protein
MNLKLLNMLLAALAAVGLAACSANPRADADFGNSVRQMTRVQAFTTGPVDASPVDSGDGERIESVLEVYRTSVSRPTEVQAPIVLDLGGAGGR